MCWMKSKHVLSGHAFLPSFAIPRTFADSNSLLSVGFAYKTLIDPSLPLNQELKLGAFSPGVVGAISIIPPLAIVFGISGSVIAGMNSTSAAQYGSSVSYNLTLGAIYEVIRTEVQVFSVALELDRPHRYSASPLIVAQTLAEGGTTDYITDTVETSWRPSLRYSHSFSPVFGLQSYLGFRFSSLREGENDPTSQSRLAFGSALDADLKPWIKVPVGFMLNYVHNHSLNSGGVSTNQLSLGIFETLSPIVNVGLEIGRIYASGNDTTAGVIVVRAYYD